MNRVGRVENILIEGTAGVVVLRELNNKLNFFLNVLWLRNGICSCIEKVQHVLNGFLPC